MRSDFAPGLLAKLAEPERADYLTVEVEDLSTEGYLRPPRVAIDPIPFEGRVVGEQVSVMVRQAEPDYPKKLLSDIRLTAYARGSGCESCPPDVEVEVGVMERL